MTDELTDLTFTNFMIKTCRITDLLLKKEYKRAIASVIMTSYVFPKWGFLDAYAIAVVM